MSSCLVDRCKPLAALAAVLLAACGGETGSEDAVTDTTDAPTDVATDDSDAAETSCASDDDCDDGIFCNGEEICGSSGVCEAGTSRDCDDDDPCTMDACDESEASCGNLPLDEDGDGYVAAEGPAGESCGGNDCDDLASDVHPDADPECDGVDHDCSGAADGDEDGDGHLSLAVCAGTGDDCDDHNEDAHPGVTPGCESFDADCDGDIDDDEDGDGHESVACLGDDCDDANGSVHPGATETCDAVDQNCDGSVLDASGADDDSDTVLDISCGGTDCNDLNQYVHPGALEDACDSVDNDCDGDEVDGVADDDDDDYLDILCPSGTDCDDTHAFRYPGAVEACDGYDDDCDGSWADGGADDDSDTVLDSACGGTDCDDADPATHAGAADGDCDLVDRDCNGSTDEFIDDDGDGWIDIACAGVITDFGTYAGLGDCMDWNAGVSPGATEICDTMDQDCDGSILDVAGADDDGDGDLDDTCEGGADCDDEDDERSSMLAEWCDGKDNDCDGAVDDGNPGGGESCGTDVGSCTAGVLTCIGTGYVCQGEVGPSDETCNGLDDDCDGPADEGLSGLPCGTDEGECQVGTSSCVAGALMCNGAINPVAETCDGLDNDCDGTADEGNPGGGAVCGTDEGACTAGVLTCIGPGYVCQGEVGPAAEICNGLDDDCDGSTDEPVQDGSWQALSAPTYTVGMPDMAWTGSEYGVVWSDDSQGDLEILFTRVSPSGVEVGAELKVTDNTTDSRSPSIVWTGSEFGVAWSDNESGYMDIHFVKLSPTGSKLTSGGYFWQAANWTIEPSLAWTGSEFGVAWEDNRDANWEIYFGRLSAAGSDMGSEVRVTNATGTSSKAAMVWTGTEYALAWSDDRAGNSEIFFNRLTGEGGKAGIDVRLTNYAETSAFPDLVDDGSGLLVAWEDSRDGGGNQEIYLARVSYAGAKVGTDIRVTSATGYGRYPAAAWTGTHLVLTWVDDRLGAYDAYMARLTPAGAKIGADEQLTFSGSGGNILYSTLIWSGSDLAVAWTGDPDVDGELNTGFGIFSVCP